MRGTGLQADVVGVPEGCLETPRGGAHGVPRSVGSAPGGPGRGYRFQGAGGAPRPISAHRITPRPCASQPARQQCPRCAASGSRRHLDTVHGVHTSWALIRVAKAFLRTPRYDTYDLAQATSLPREVVDNLVARMVGEGWLSTEDGWAFELTPTGEPALRTVLTQARTFNQTRQGRT
jgi:hypothetical protein